MNRRPFNLKHFVRRRLCGFVRVGSCSNSVSTLVCVKHPYVIANFSKMFFTIPFVSSFTKNCLLSMYQLSGLSSLPLHAPSKSLIPANAHHCTVLGLQDTPTVCSTFVGNIFPSYLISNTFSCILL